MIMKQTIENNTSKRAMIFLYVSLFFYQVITDERFKYAVIFKCVHKKEKNTRRIESNEKIINLKVSKAVSVYVHEEFSVYV